MRKNRERSDLSWRKWVAGRQNFVPLKRWRMNTTKLNRCTVSKKRKNNKGSQATRPIYSSSRTKELYRSLS